MATPRLSFGLPFFPFESERPSRLRAPFCSRCPRLQPFSPAAPPHYVCICSAPLSMLRQQLVALVVQMHISNNCSRAVAIRTGARKRRRAPCKRASLYRGHNHHWLADEAWKRSQLAMLLPNLPYGLEKTVNVGQPVHASQERNAVKHKLCCRLYRLGHPWP